MIRIFLLLLSAVMLSGCFSDTMLKKSANNKLIDTKGFHGSKRRPLYNKKYIDKAKHNVSRGEFEDDEYDDEDQYLENLPPTLKNRYMYEDMIEEDIKAERSRRAKKKSKYHKKAREAGDGYSDVGRGRDRVRAAGSDSNDQELKRELKEIRTLLDAAREDLVKYRCPVDENGNPAPLAKKAAPKKKIHEQVRDEEKKSAPKAPAKKPSPKKQKPKAIPVIKPKAPAEKPDMSPPKVEAPMEVTSVPSEVPVADPMEDLAQQGAPAQAAPEPVPASQAEILDIPALPEVPSNIIPPQNNETISISPEQSLPQIEEVQAPQLTEIPPSPSDEIEEPTNPSIPSLPTFPMN